jgi:hypothetical protein
MHARDLRAADAEYFDQGFRLFWSKNDASVVQKYSNLGGS